MRTATKPAPARGAVSAGPAARKMTLAGIRKGKKKSPDRILLYGVKGVGKSTFAASAPAAVFISPEDGVDELDVAVFDDPRPQAYDEVVGAVEALATEEHEYRTLVIDTIDWVEHLVRDKIISSTRDTKTGRPWTPADYDAFGRGVNLAVDEFRKLIEAMERMQRAKGMDVVLLAHARAINFKNPVGEDYMMYSPAMGGRPLIDLWGDWVKAVLFANYDIEVQKGRGWEKNKARADGTRVVYTQFNACWEAKNRHGLPPAIDLNWDDYVAFRDQERSASVQGMFEEIDQLKQRLGLTEKTAAKLDEKVKQAGEHPGRLQKVIDFLSEKVAAKEGGDDAGS